MPVKLLSLYNDKDKRAVTEIFNKHFGKYYDQALSADKAISNIIYWIHEDFGILPEYAK